MKPYGILGDGRAARHTATYFSALGIPYLPWSRETAKRDTSLSLRTVAEACDVLLVLLSDRAIEPFIQTHPELAGKTLIHFSGSLVTPLAYGMHPLMTFAAQTYPTETYEKMAFVCDDNAPAFHIIFPHLANRHFKVKPEKKALYHALCVMSGNFTTLLWQNLFSRFEDDLDLPRDIAEPYLERIAQNLLEAPERALTGPIARADLETIQRNLASLENDPFQKIYQAFVDAFLPRPRPYRENESRL
jgi:predicted short-subunit dehydrogenase-like oxidoreductase (DUF2520 family)